MKAKVGLCWGIVCAMMACGAMAAERADFTTGEGTNGWTISAAEFLSPAYASAVDRISLSYSGAADGAATVSAIANGGGEAPVATLSAAATAATFDFPETTDFRAFRISTTGDWRLFSFAADVSATFIDPPTGLTVSNNTTGTSFDLSWMPVAGATGYRVYVWTNVTVGVSAGAVVWQETFANAPAKTTTVNFKDEFTDDGTAGWEFDKAYASISDGAVRIGTTSDKGYLMSPSLTEVSGQDQTLRITAWRQTTSEGTDMPIGVVSGGVTNIVGVIVLGDVSATYHVALPAFRAGDRVALFSPTNKASARAIIDDVAILSGYSEGHQEPSYIVDGRDVGDSLFCTLDNLPSVAVSCAVAAVGRRGAVSASSVAVPVDLANPDKIPVLNAFPLSDLEEGCYAQNFDSLSYVVNTTSGSPWFNGSTLTYWQLWQDGLAPTNISFYAGGNQTGARFVALAENSADPVRAFGARAKQGTSMVWGIAFTNDTDSIVKVTNVSYSVQQWGFANTNSHALALSYLVTNRLDWTSNFADGWRGCCETDAQCLKDVVHETPVVTETRYVPQREIKVHRGDVIYFRWTLEPPASGNSALMAIDDLTVTFSRASRALVLHIH